MKKVAFFGFMASILMLSGAAFAADTEATLTTQGYVNDGLKALYKKIDNDKADKTALADKADKSALDAKADADTVYTKTEVNTTFATKEELQGIVPGETYSAAQNGGLKVNDDNEFGLNIDSPVTDAMYVYKNGTWSALVVKDTFPENFNFETVEEGSGEGGE